MYKGKKRCAEQTKVATAWIQRKKQMVALTIYIWTIYKWNTTVPCTELPSWTTCIMIPPVASATTGIQNMDTKQAYLRSARLRSSSSVARDGAREAYLIRGASGRGIRVRIGLCVLVCLMTSFSGALKMPWSPFFATPSNDANGTSKSVTGWKNTWEVWKIALY